MSKAIDTLKDILSKYQYASINLVVADLKQELIAFSDGYYDLDSKAVVDSDAIYRIASISKTVLALASMMLVDRGLLDLDEDISKYLGFKVANPHYPDVLITCRMLMTQTSSITDGFSDEELTNETRQDGYNGVNGTTLNVTLETLLNDLTSPYYSDLTFDTRMPGTTFIYSNFGCGILACIIEKISGMYYDDFLQKYLFKPLNLDASFKIERIKNINKVVSLYTYDNGFKLSRCPASFLEKTYPIWPLGENYRGPAGGLFISMRGLSVIMRALMSFNVPNISAKTCQLMFEKNWEGSVRNYRAKGLQMNIFSFYHQITTYGHFGSAYGVRSFMLFSPQYQKGICFITSGANVNTVEYDICDLHKDVYLWFLETFILGEKRD